MDARALLPIVERGYERYLESLRAMVNVDCGSFSPDGVDAVADQCEARFRDGGWTVERIPHRPAPGAHRLGDCVVGMLGGDRPAARGGVRFLLAAHTDTVFPEGTAAARPFRVDGDRATGPGVNDCKGGLIAGFHAVEALLEAGFRDFASVTFVCNPDEEVGSPFSTPIIRERAGEADVALVLEAGRESGAIVSARKGVGVAKVEVRGRSAHAGVNPDRGRSAIVSAARLVLEIVALNGRWEGVTLNPGVIAGGTRANVVAERCIVDVDVRSQTVAGFEAAQAALEAVVGDPGDGIDAAMKWLQDHGPMERTVASARLVAAAVAVAAELGFDLVDVATGGASDGNTTAAAGVPTLDGLGPIGGDPHAAEEWLDLSSVVPRVTMLAGLIARVAAGTAG